MAQYYRSFLHICVSQARRPGLQSRVYTGYSCTTSHFFFLQVVHSLVSQLSLALHPLNSAVQLLKQYQVSYCARGVLSCLIDQQLRILLLAIILSLEKLHREIP
jgi:hypothetical protein